MQQNDLVKFFSKLLDFFDWCELYSGATFPPENTVILEKRLRCGQHCHLTSYY